MAAAARSADGTSGATPYWLAGIAGAAAFMEVLDTSIANVSLPHIAGSLSASQDEAAWVLTSYLVANAIIIPMTGWLSNTLGRRRYYIASIFLFTVASVLCGLAPSLPFLVTARVLQGLAGAALQPVSQAIMSDAFPPAKRSMSLAVYSMAAMGGPVVGPTLGGFITDTYSWHWIFLMNAPVGAILIPAALLLVHDSPEQREVQRRRHSEAFTIDYLGFALIALGIGALQIMLDKGQEEDWLDSDLIRGCLLVSVTSLSALIWWELRHPHPIVNLRLFGNRNFATANLMMCGMSVVTFSSVVLLPQFTQNVLGFSAQDAGMVMTPGALMLLVLMPVSARIANKVDPRLAISLGFLAFAAGLTATSLFASLSVTQSDLMLLRMAQNVGILLLALPINVLMYVGLAPGDGGSASAMINLMRNLGSSIGASLAVEWLVRGTQIHQSQLLGRVNVLDRAYQVYTRAIAGSFDAGTMPALLESVIRKQALLLSYIDDFRYFATIALLLAPMIWLSRRAIGVSPPPAH